MTIQELQPGEYWPDSFMDSTSDERRARIETHGQIHRATATESAYVLSLATEAQHVTSDRHAFYWMEWIEAKAPDANGNKWQRFSTQRPATIPQVIPDRNQVLHNWAALGLGRA